jgi:hypothetical protein
MSLISDIENCRGRAHSQCQGKHGSDSKSRTPPQHAETKPQIGPKRELPHVSVPGQRPDHVQHDILTEVGVIRHGW